MQIATNVEFRAQALSNGKVELLLQEGGREIFRAEFEPQDAGGIATGLLRAAHGVFYDSRKTPVAPDLGTQVHMPIPTSGWGLGSTKVQGQKALILMVGDASAAFIVPEHDMRKMGRALLVASWRTGSTQSVLGLLRLLLRDFAADLRGWGGVFRARCSAVSRHKIISFSSWISGRSLRLFQTIAIDPSVSPPRYGPVGECIYCGVNIYSTKPGIRTRPLGDEHIIAEGLGGKLELPEASCQKCEDTTGRLVEGDVLLRTLKGLRLHLKIRGKSRSSRPDTLPLEATIDGKQQKIDMPVEDYPVIFNMPVYGVPGVFTGGEGGNQTTAGFQFVVLQYDERKLRKDYGITAASTPYWDTHMLFRMLGKIAHAFAAAELGKGKFTPDLVEMILTGKPDQFNHIGGDPYGGTKSKALHELGLGYQRANNKNYVVAKICLFANHGGPIYHIVVGESLESAFARFKRVFSNRIGLP